MRLFDDRMYESLIAFTKIGYSNPFLPERIELERKALKRLFKGKARVWSKSADFRETRENLETFGKVIRPIIEGLRIEVFKNKKIIKKDLLVYEELVLFYLFYGFTGVSQSFMYNRLPMNAKSLAPLYKKFKETAEYFFQCPNYDFPIKNQISHIFSCFFQVSRAFYFIFEYIVGASKPTAKLRASIWQSIFTHNRKRFFEGVFKKMQSIPTLITGPSGTGKELVAQAISYSCYIPFNEKTNNFESDYLEGFYTLNLSTLSPTLIESELFGHKKGAFTGALEEHRGYFDNCGSTGAVFLDEIGEIDPQTQVKLLNLLQTRQFKRVGDTNPLYFEGKILAATNRNLALEMEEGNFREDFYYRLCADQIRTPSLYEQLEDSPGELDNLVKFLSKKVAGPENSVALSKETLEFIRKDMPKNYSWPGNIRELEQCIRSVMVNGEYIPSVKIKSEKNFKHNFYAGDITAKELIRQYAALVYKDCGSYSETARRLDVDYRTVKSYL